MLQSQFNNKNRVQNNILSFEGEGFGSQANRHDDFKNQYSTFIQQLQQTTQKLMNQVFNAEYKPQIDDLWQADQDEKYHKSANQVQKKGANSFKPYSRISKFNAYGKIYNEIPNSQSFKNFMIRSDKWCQKKQNFIKKQKHKKQIQQQKQLTKIPRILRGSIQKLQPIYDRALQIHTSKQKKIAIKKIQQKRKQDQQINSYSFHPELTSKNKNKSRTLQQYLKDKQQWERKKIESRQFRKLKQQAQKYMQCSFTPNLISKQIQDEHLRIRPGQKVEERLLRSLQKAFQVV